VSWQAVYLCVDILHALFSHIRLALYQSIIIRRRTLLPAPRTPATEFNYAHFAREPALRAASSLTFDWNWPESSRAVQRIAASSAWATNRSAFSRPRSTLNVVLSNSTQASSVALVLKIIICVVIHVSVHPCSCVWCHCCSLYRSPLRSERSDKS
jgi:hypothetical protein